MPHENTYIVSFTLRASWDGSLGPCSREEEGLTGLEMCAGKPRIAPGVPARCPTVFLECCVHSMKGRGREKSNLIQFGSDKVDFAAALPLMSLFSQILFTDIYSL